MKILALLLLFALTSCKDFKVMSWNLENLFDDKIDGNEYREFYKWNESDFERKTENIADAISRLNKRRLPDILFLQEVENENSLDKLNENFYLLTGEKYEFNYISPDLGLAVKNAIFSKHALNEVKNHFIAGKHIQEASLTLHKSKLTFFNVHLKSGTGKYDREKRIEAGLFLLSRISELYEQNGTSLEILIAGDFNSNKERKNDIFSKMETLDILKRSGDEKDHLSFFYYCDPEFGTYYYKGKNECLDYILLNENLFDKKGFYLKKIGVFKEDFLFYKEKIPYRYVRKTGRGYSDHLPIFLDLGYR